MNIINNFKQDFSVSALFAGIISIIVGYAGPTILVFQVAQNSNIAEPYLISWLWSYSIASGLLTIVLSLLTKQPLIFAWSTPGIAFLVFGLKDTPFEVAIGAFIVSNLIILILGYSGIFKKIMDKIPMSIAGALNAGILLPFALEAINSTKSAPEIAVPMLLAYFISLRLFPRWSVAIVFIIGIILAFFYSDINFNIISFETVTPIFAYPEFQLSSLINLAIPLTVLALTGQYLPGIAVLKSFGYKVDSTKIVKASSFMSILAAPFGCHSVNPSSMIAGIVAGPDAHKMKDKRYVASIFAGFTYILFGTFAGTFVYIFKVFPTEAILVLAGVSLLSAIASSLKIALTAEPKEIIIPVVVFCVALSGIEIYTIGAPFWAIIIGTVLSIFKHFTSKTN